MVHPSDGASPDCTVGRKDNEHVVVTLTIVPFFFGHCRVIILLLSTQEVIGNFIEGLRVPRLHVATVSDVT